jgi:hypothetical protein
MNKDNASLAAWFIYSLDKLQIPLASNIVLSQGEDGVLKVSGLDVWVEKSVTLTLLSALVQLSIIHRDRKYLEKEVRRLP